MEHPPADLHVTLADELSTEEELREDPSQARWDETLNILTSLVNAPNVITINEAVRKIDDHFLEYVMEGDESDEGQSPNVKKAEHFPNAFWYYLVSVAIQIPDGHSAQDQLTQRVWADLPDLGMEIHEGLRNPDRYTLGLEELAARMVQEVDYDLNYLAVDRINQVLVLKSPEPLKEKKRGENQLVVVHPIDPSLHHIEIWIGIAGQKIYQACQRNTENMGEVDWDNTSPALTVNLWNSWKSRIREIKMDGQESADRREMAERIEALMIAREEEEEMGTDL
ncbi:hypothetical protein BKA70DRAFT_1431381 [Coprinopsis sp. MPI-PUGE-AT-0042]|nr:hypothetical protein BKA70DRAFT_1431381 [Coprinopsis sp. MPI-PUGE-AT-0042]